MSERPSLLSRLGFNQPGVSNIRVAVVWCWLPFAVIGMLARVAPFAVIGMVARGTRKEKKR